MMRVKDCRAKGEARLQVEEVVGSTKLMRRLARPIEGCMERERGEWANNLTGYLDRDR